MGLFTNLMASKETDNWDRPREFKSFPWRLLLSLIQMKISVASQQFYVFFALIFWTEAKQVESSLSSTGNLMEFEPLPFLSKFSHKWIAGIFRLLND